MVDWKYIAREKLKDYPARVASIESIPMEMERLSAEITSIRSSMSNSGAVKGGGGTRDDQIVTNLALREELARNLKQTKKAVSLVDNALSVLDSEERRMINLMYIYRSKGNAERLRQEFGLEDVSSVYRRSEKALRHFTVAMFGLTDS